MMLTLLAGVELADRAVIAHDAGPDFATLAFMFRQLVRVVEVDGGR